ncbi:DNA cross-link repair 1A protein [Galdieria sulphuraria]|nr:DNA cross-link repair 1A protein [Galdieria sulphuraria]
MSNTEKKRSRQVFGWKTPPHVVRKVATKNGSSTQMNLLDVLSSPVTVQKKRVDSNDDKDANPIVEERLFLRAWLLSLQLEYYEDILVAHGIDSLATLKTLDEETLKTIGVHTLGARKKIIQNLSDCEFPPTFATDGGNTCLSLASLHLSSDKSVCKDDPNNALPSHESQSLKNKSPMSSRAPKEPSGAERKLYPIFYANHNNVNMIETASVQDKKSKGHPFSKRVPGTSFTVDSFKMAGQGDCRQFFLSHFHSDHTMGLTSRFQAGVIFCSRITASLIRSQLGVKDEYICVLELNQSCYVQDEGKSTRGTMGATVTVLDANHCPGSVMFLFFVWQTKELILHTGDFRYSIELHSQIPQMFGKSCLDYLFLDTTYCNPRYDFPSQQEAVEAVLEAVKAESFHSRVLFLFGTYQIGKEKVFLHVAERLNEKVYVDKRKYRILNHLSLPENVQNLLTTEPSASRLHVVDMRTVSFGGMREIAKNYATRYNTFVAFRPTGWSYTGKKMLRSYGNLKPGILTRQLKQNCVLYGVPYSEHSSFSELREFVSICRPKNLIPTLCFLYKLEEFSQ